MAYAVCRAPQELRYLAHSGTLQISVIFVCNKSDKAVS